MGLVGAWYYGDADLGSAIETAEIVIEKIKRNKFDKDDLKELDKALTELKKAIENED